MSSTNSKIAGFRRVVWKHYETDGRFDLPWRKTRDPYRILVSEVMLQQTQVERVVPYFKTWMTQFPSVRVLANASLKDVLTAWQGLGYNRRGKHLHQAAKALAKLRSFPKTPVELEQLPGVGTYTARAVAAFAYNQDVVFVETNIRTAVTHYFFPNKRIVADQDILAVLERALPHGKSREWHAALMDYGSYLKRSGVRINAKAKGYTKQSAFRGSAREARGAVLKALSKTSRTQRYLTGILGDDRKEQVEQQLRALSREGMIVCSRGKCHLPH